MSDGICTRCGHGRREHRRWTKRQPWACAIDPTWPRGFCECPSFTQEILPPEGEQLEFGVHRLPQDEAETAPAWPPLP